MSDIAKFDWGTAGAIAGAVAVNFALAAYGAIKGRHSDQKAKEAQQMSQAANQTSAATAAEILPPHGADRPSLYDVIMAVRDGMTDLSTVVRAHRQEYIDGITDLRADMRSLRDNLDNRITTLEKAVQNHVLTEKRISELEGAMRRIEAGRQ